MKYKHFKQALLFKVGSLYYFAKYIILLCQVYYITLPSILYYFAKYIILPCQVYYIPCQVYHISLSCVPSHLCFYNCSGLTSIYAYAEKVLQMGSNVFRGCDAKKCTVYVPKGTYYDYRLSDFRYFENIVEFDATGIDKTTTSTDVEEVSRYSVNGQRLVGPTKGLNIVKYSDGSVKKVAAE